MPAVASQRKHRKPKPGPFVLVTARQRRSAATLTAAAAAATAAATVVGLAEPGAAQAANPATTRAASAPESGRTPSAATVQQIRARVDRLDRQAEQAGQAYDAEQAAVAALQRRADTLQDQVARSAAAAESARTAVGSLAASQYRDGTMSGSIRLILADDPSTFLGQASDMAQLDATEQQQVRRYAQQSAVLERQEAAARRALEQLSAERRRLAAAKATVESKLAQAKRLLATLDAEQRAEVARQQQAAAGAAGAAKTPSGTSGAAHTASGSEADGAGGTGGGDAASPRAAEAVSFAREQLGKPYAWGATGPGAYDCSGLTQAAWAAAGVSLPRTTYQQIDAGRRIPVSRLRPGDLVFYYSGVSHVGIYVGGGRIIHAPHPGAPVRYAPVDSMPVVGAVRPG